MNLSEGFRLNSIGYHTLRFMTRSDKRYLENEAAVWKNGE